jgi:hypothetical protein
MTYMLGKLPPKRPYAAVRIKLRDYLVLPTPPKYRGWAQGVNFRMYLNDTLGDCAVASIGHIAQTHTRRDGHEVDPMDDQIRALYHATGIEQGLSDDDGRYMEGVLKHLRTKQSFLPILGYAAVDPLNTVEVKTAAFLFGGLYAGVALPETARWQLERGQNWSMAPAPGRDEPGSWGGHAIYVPAYYTGSLTAATWGERQSMTWAWLRKYCDELYCLVSETWADPKKPSPSGVNRAQLVADLKAV